MSNRFGRFFACVIFYAACATPGLPAMPHVISSLGELRRYAGEDNVEVTLKPGIYEINLETARTTVAIEYRETDGRLVGSRTTDALLNFSGQNSTYNLYGVIIKIDTAVHQVSAKSFDKILISGNGNTLRGLEIIDQGDTPARGSSVRMLHVSGDRNTLDQIGLWSRGSSPYGYGNLLGKGSNSLVDLHKQTTLLVTGCDTVLRNLRIVSRSFGHGLVMQGAVNTLIEDCSIEGVMRTTDDILLEPAGLARSVDFKSDYPPGKIVGGQMIALSEDGVRAYPDGTAWSKRRTRDLIVRRTSVRNMRSGFDLSAMSGRVVVSDCLAIGCNEKGYSVPSGGVIERSAGDTLYGPLLSLHDRDNHDCRIELEWLPGTSGHPPLRFAEINGRGHHIVFRTKHPLAHASPLPIVFGESFWADVNLFRNPSVDPLTGATNVHLINETPMPVILRKVATACKVSSTGPILQDEGQGNQHERVKRQ